MAYKEINYHLYNILNSTFFILIDPVAKQISSITDLSCHADISIFIDLDHAYKRFFDNTKANLFYPLPVYHQCECPL